MLENDKHALNEFADRFDEQAFLEDEFIVAWVSTAVQSVYPIPTHRVPRRILDRCQLVAEAYDLALMSQVLAHNWRLEREECEALMREMGFMRALLNDPLVEKHLKGLIEMAARTCELPHQLRASMHFGFGEPDGSRCD